MFADAVKAQFHHPPVGILVLYACEFVSDGCRDAEFFFELAAQGVARLLAFFNLSTGKFPLQRHGLMARALANEQLAIFLDRGCDDALHGSSCLCLPFATLITWM